MHDAIFSALANLSADLVRFVPWFPYPKLAVAELDPPTGNPICVSAYPNTNLTLWCPHLGGLIDSIDYAEFAQQVRVIVKVIYLHNDNGPLCRTAAAETTK